MNGDKESVWVLRGKVLILITIILFLGPVLVVTHGHIQIANIKENQYDNLQNNETQATLHQAFGEYNEERLEDMIVDNEGFIYITGFTKHSIGWNKFAFVSKLSLSGDIIWIETIKADNIDYGVDLTFDEDGDLWLIGKTESENFAVISSNDPQITPIQDHKKGVEDEIILAKLSAETGEILYFTYWGGSNDENDPLLSIDSLGRLVFVTSTLSFDFPTIGNQINNTRMGDYDLGITMLSKSNDSIIWSTYCGGINDETPKKIINDNENNILIVGETGSTDFPFSNKLSTGYGGGQTDGFITKISPDGTIIWSRYFGGIGLDTIYDIKIDNESNLFIVGATNSKEIEGIDLSSQYNDGKDGFVAKLTEEGSISWIKLIGGSLEDSIQSLDLLDNQILIGGETKSADFIQKELTTTNSDAFFALLDLNGVMISETATAFGGNGNEEISTVEFNPLGDIIVSGTTEVAPNFPIDHIFENSYGGVFDAFVGQFDTSGNLIWMTVTPVISNPEKDTDKDGLVDQEEYDHCIQSMGKQCPDPLNPDTDNDKIVDGWEVAMGLNPVGDDASLDYDNDELTNLQEFVHDTNPYSLDTDNDGIPDNWEVEMNLNPLVDDAENDFDGDSLPNIWEFQNQLEANNSKDASMDSDKDGLSNLKEFDLGTDPNDKDTDGDGIPDGWEVDHDLNPNDHNDANKDLDNDGLTPLWEYRLRWVGGDPQSRIDLFVLLGIVFLALTCFGAVFIRRKHSSNLAREEGYDSLKHKKSVQKAGFSNLAELNSAKALGFLNTQVQEFTENLGFDSSDNMVKAWNELLSDIQLEFSQLRLNELVTQIQNGKTPHELNKNEEIIVEETTKIERSSEKLQYQLDKQEELITIIEELKAEAFMNLTLEDLEELANVFNFQIRTLGQYQSTLRTEMEKIRDWLKPWQRILTLIQMTEDGVPITLQKIVEVVETETSHTEELLTLLLTDFPEIGKYSTKTQIYTKGTDIDDYLLSALKAIGKQ